MSNTEESLKVRSTFLNENTASIVMKSGILASTGKHACYSGSGYLIKNLLNYRIYLLQKDSTVINGMNCSIENGYVFDSQIIAWICLCFFLFIIIDLLAVKVLRSRVPWGPMESLLLSLLLE